MSYKKISLSIIMLFLLIPMTNTIAFIHIDNVKDGNYVFFLIDLEVDENLELNLTHTGSGNFTLFLFNTRPELSYVNDDKTLNENIFTKVVNYSLDDNPYINFTATELRIYYIEIILISGGPDTFTLTANKDLTRYYLPIIPGFQLEMVIFSLIVALGLIVIFYKKNVKIIS